MGRNSFTVARRDYRISITHAKRKSFCVKFAQKLFAFFEKNPCKFFFAWYKPPCLEGMVHSGRQTQMVKGLNNEMQDLR